MSNDRIRTERLQKVADLRQMGSDPYGSRVDITAEIAKVRDMCPPAEAGESATPPAVTVAGRVMAIRDMGKSKWLDLVDRSGKIQVNLLAKRLGDAFAQMRLLDIGDFLAVSGDLMRSKVGEITIFATSARIMCKSLEPLPEKWKGLRDVETRYRRRYIDLVANEEVRERFMLRSRIIREIRRFLEERGFLEVETPMLQPIYGGAAARPFITHHNALGIDLYLRISPETYLKRLLVGGLDRVFEINRNFRNEGIDTSHNPEFTMIEIYQAYADFEVMMELTESLVESVAQQTLGTTRVQFGGQEIDFAKPWPRRRIHDLVRAATGIDPQDTECLCQALAEHGALPPEKRKALASIEPALRHDMLIKEAMDEIVEPSLVQPTFVTHYPASLNPLCKRNRDDPTLSDRFEAIVAGMELANAFSELNDPIEQRQRFEEQVKRQEEDEKYCNAVDDDYISALEVGMPPAGGLGIGIDRLVMLLTGQTSIREVILFPTLRPQAAHEGAAAAPPEGE